MLPQFKATYQSRIDEAQRLGGAKLVKPLPEGGYTVTGRKGDIYTITYQESQYGGLEPVCNCVAGQHGTPCWHAACVWLYRAVKGTAEDTAARGLAARRALWG